MFFKKLSKIGVSSIKFNHSFMRTISLCLYKHTQKCIHGDASVCVCVCVCVCVTLTWPGRAAKAFCRSCVASKKVLSHFMRTLAQWEGREDKNKGDGY